MASPLEQDLEQRAAGSRLAAEAVDRWAFMLLELSVACSAAAAVIAAAGWLPAPATAAVSALSGVFGLTLTSFKFGARSRWWWRKYHLLDSLLRELRYLGVGEKEVAAAMDAALREHRERWPGFGESP